MGCCAATWSSKESLQHESSFFVAVFLFRFPLSNPRHIPSHSHSVTSSSSYPLTYSEPNSSVPSLLPTTTSPSCSPHLSPSLPPYFALLLLLHLHLTVQLHKRVFSALNKNVLEMSVLLTGSKPETWVGLRAYRTDMSPYWLQALIC